jgi:hypothetical protein
LGRENTVQKEGTVSLSKAANAQSENGKNFHTRRNLFKEDWQYPNHPIWNANFLPNENKKIVRRGEEKNQTEA